MTLQEGTNNHKLIAGYNRAQLIAEARRLGNNHRLCGSEYTAGLLEAMADQMEREA